MMMAGASPTFQLVLLHLRDLHTSSLVLHPFLSQRRAMTKRSRRAEMFEGEKRELLTALGSCRAGLIRHLSALRYGSPTYALCTAVVEAIDALAGLLTGDPRHFHAKSYSTGQHAPAPGDQKGPDSE